MACLVLGTQTGARGTWQALGHQGWGRGREQGRSQDTVSIQPWRLELSLGRAPLTCGFMSPANWSVLVDPSLSFQPVRSPLLSLAASPIGLELPLQTYSSYSVP